MQSTTIAVDTAALFICFTRQLEQALAPPNPHNADLLSFTFVHDAKWRMNEFPQILLAEFWNNSAHVWIVANGFDSFKDFRHQPPTDLRHQLTFIPSLNFLKIPNGGLSERDGSLSHQPIALTVFLLPSRRPHCLIQGR